MATGPGKYDGSSQVDLRWNGPAVKVRLQVDSEQPLPGQAYEQLGNVTSAIKDFYNLLNRTED